MTNPKALEDLTASVPGWTSLKERLFLYETAKSIKGQGGAIVEIGSWKGKSTIWLAQGAKDGKQAKVYAVDHFIGSSEHQGEKPVWTFDEFKENIKLANLKDIVNPIVANSETAVKDWKLPIEFIFIDGAHEYEEVKKDFLLWSPFLIDGGIIAFHDTTPDLKAILENLPIFGLPGPKEVAFKYVLNSKYFCDAGLAGSIVYATKCRQRSFKGWLRSQNCKITIYFRYILYYCYLMLTYLPNPVKRFIKSSFIRN